MSNELKETIVVDAEDRTKTAFNGIENNFNSLQKRIEKMQPAFKSMAISGGVAFAAITAGSARALSAYADAERSQRQLEHAILDVSKGTKEQVAAITEVSNALQRKAGIDGDALAMGAAQLSTFGLQSKSVVNLTKTLADLTVNQNGVNASADAYVSSANIMSKALRGEFGLLEKQGIRFTEAQKKILQYGTEAEKVAAIQEGFAQNLRETTDTLSGVDVGYARITRQLGEIQESVGKALAPAFDELSKKLVPIIISISDWIDANPQLAATIIEVSAAIAGLVMVTGTIGIALGRLAMAATALKISMVALIGWIGLIPIIIAAAIAAGVLIYKNWDTIKKKAVEIWKYITAFFQQTWRKITAGFSDTWKKVSEWSVNTWGSITRFLTDTWSGIMQTAKSIWDSISSFFVNLWSGISNVFKTAVNFIVGLVALGFNAMGLDITEVMKNISSGLTSAWENVKLIWNTYIALILGITQSVWSAITGYIGDKITEAKNIVSNVWKTIEGIWQNALNWISQTTAGWGENIKNSIGGIVQWISEKFNWLGENMAGLLKKATNITDQIGKSIGDATRTTGGVVYGAAQSAGSMIGNAFNSVVAAGSKITGFADGGMVGGYLGQPQLAVVHGGERVLTAEEAQRGSGQTINFYFNEVVAGDTGVKSIIKQAIAQLNRNTQLKTVGGI